MATQKSEACEHAIAEVCKRHILSLIVCNAWWLRYGLDDMGFDSWQGQEIFSLLEMLIPALGPIRPPIQRLRRFFPRRKASGAWGQLSSQSNADVRNELGCTLPSLCASWHVQEQIYLSALHITVWPTFLQLICWYKAYSWRNRLVLLLHELDPDCSAVMQKDKSEQKLLQWKLWV